MYIPDTKEAHKNFTGAGNLLKQNKSPENEDMTKMENREEKVREADGTEIEYEEENKEKRRSRRKTRRTAKTELGEKNEK